MDSQSTQLPLAAPSLPHDVLNEIFLHCLPRLPLDAVQPDPRIAPMLLCHVCSSWRAIALANSSLWSYLYLRLPIQWDKDGRLGPTVWDTKTFRRNLLCLIWWRQNQGSRAPFIRFEFDRPDEDSYRIYNYKPNGLRLTGATMKFLIKYMSSAQYLDVGLFSRYLIKQDSDNGHDVECPHLHTLVTKFPNYDDDNDDNSHSSSRSSDDIENWDTLPPLVLVHIPPTLRRLSMREGVLPQDYNNNWSTLTHLSLKHLFLLPKAWFSVIRGVLNLQWGNFCILFLDDGSQPLSHGILPFLSILSVDVDTMDDIFVPYPLGRLFQNLHLPALKILSLCSNAESWYEPNAIKEVNAALRSAPAVTKLALGPKFLSSAYTHANVFEKVWKSEPPLSVLAPRLTHLELDMCCFDEDNNTKISQYVAYWQELFFSMHWLDLASPTNTVRTMSIFVKAVPGFDPLAFPFRMRDKVSSAIEEYVKKADDVAFEILLVDNRETLQDGWKTWDLHLPN